MKLFSIIFIGFFCGTIISGAPSSENPSLDETLYLNPINAVFDKVKDIWAHVKCMKNVVDEVMEGSELKNRWTDARAQLKTIFDIEWQKCSEISSKFEQEKCRLECIEKSASIITKFLSSLFDGNQMDLINEIRTKISAQCFGEHNAIERVFDDSQRKDSPMTDTFQCLVDTLEKVSKDLNLDEIWNSIGLEIQANLDNWKECSNLEGQFAVIFCNVREGVQTYKLLVNYVREAMAKNIDFSNYLITEYRRNCAPSMYGIDKNIEHLKCVIEATGAAVKETDFGIIWDEYRSDIDKVLQRIKECQNQSDKWEVAKCVNKEIYGSFDILKNFMNHLKKANYQTYDRIKKYIKQRCSQ